MIMNIFSAGSRGAGFLAEELAARGERNEFLTDGSLDDGSLDDGRLTELIQEAGRFTSEDTIRIFLISDSEKKNLNDALYINEISSELSAAAAAAHKSLYVFSSSGIARAVLDSIDFKDIDINLIDPVETAAWNLMENHPLYEMRDRLGDEEIRVLIIGSGAELPELIKTVYWCGRMRLFRLKMNMIGGDMSRIETEMKFRCPGLFTQTMQENIDMRERGLITPELYLPLRLTRAHYMQADTATEAFEIELNKCLDANYIIINEPDDESTIRTALAVRAHFIRKHILSDEFLKGQKPQVTKLPGIYAYIRDERLSDIIPHLTVEGHPADPGNDELNIIPFGSDRSVYSAGNIVDDPLGKLSEALFPDEFKAACGSSEDASDDSRKYVGGSMPPSVRRMLKASALHLRYKLRDMNMIPRGYKPEIYNTDNFPQLRDVSTRRAKEIEQNFKFEMTALEHQSWTVFKLTDGWIPADAYHALGYGRLFKDGHREHRQFAGRMSAACVESSALSGTGIKLYGSPGYFTEYDRRTAARTCETIRAVYPDTEFTELVKMEFDD